MCVALRSVHALGYAFGDIKPENILITASGHAKITDFGAARPLVGHAAAAAAISSARKLILNLRDGDWRARDGGKLRLAAPHDGLMDVDAPVGEAEEDDGDGEYCDPADRADARLEGTAAYLAPELVKGEAPSVASDGWAYGCTLYQALAGRPPLWADTQAEMFRRIVRFEPLRADDFYSKVHLTSRRESITECSLTIACLATRRCLPTRRISSRRCYSPI